MTRLLACCALLLTLTACGQRGPLYLPSQPPPRSQQPLGGAHAVAPPTPAASAATPAAPASAGAR